MIASLGVWGLDRGMRFLRTGLIHVGYLNSTKGKSHYHKILTTLLTCLDFGFHSSQATVKYFDDEDGGVIRLEFIQNMEAVSNSGSLFMCPPIPFSFI
jgi:ferric-chelate reductase